MLWKLQYQMRPSLTGVRRITDVTQAALAGLTSEELCRKLELALVEACTNAVQHGSKASSALVRVTMEMDDQEIRTVVQNQGEPFDFDTKATQDPGALDLENLPLGGRGIPLMRQLTDFASYEHENGITSVTLVQRHGATCESCSAIEASSALYPEKRR